MGSLPSKSKCPQWCQSLESLQEALWEAQDSLQVLGINGNFEILVKRELVDYISRSSKPSLKVSYIQE